MGVEVGILAHNEAGRIAACLNSLPLADARYKVHVLVNGSSDDTARIAGAIAAGHPNLTVHDFKEGGKARTWNRFIYDIAGEAEAYILMDGDAVIADGSFEELVSRLEANPHLNIIAGLPLNGRSVVAYQEEMRRDHGLFGDLYAVSGNFVRRLKAKNIRLPVGLIGDDSLVAAMAKTDLEPLSNWKDERIGTADHAGFYCEEVSPFNPDDLVMQYKRLKNYSLRHFQNRIFQKIMKDQGPSGLPATAAELYRMHPEVLKLRFRGVSTYFDWLALRRIKSEIT